MTERTVRGRPAPASRSALAARATALTYLAVLLIIPLAIIVQDGLRGGVGSLLGVLTQPVARSALWLSLWTAAVMAVINAVMGTLTAYVLVRYRFPGRALLSALIDLPFAIPTLVAGVMLVVLYGPQRALGAWLGQNLGLQIIFAPPGIILALLFVTFPFVTRAVEPVLAALERDQEEAAATIGAGTLTIFRRVVLPALAMPIATGALLSFARAIGEFGAIVVVAGNIPLRSQTAAVYVFGEIESENQRAATAMSVVMLLIAFGLVLLVDYLQRQPHDA
ncbi:MAG TPA: sulfate ABC transporter permease subunit CysT [Kouleothrix sp.]|uniref:sulfate ABC transporter permease subunit CysT n=1 Tax=Kouleothrix sp. TaxID=2779161 RepID=UPI002B6174DD|nr:sulfate ABC transporter permease subunit CysT [Kouleothrix sp.]HRC77394.1 sulfate ABC transporter permease subunit CysT [Kouleothrix sp.]